MKKTVKVNFFKESGKFYMVEDIGFECQETDDENADTYQNRISLENAIKKLPVSNEFTAVVVNDDLIGYPMMVKP